MSGIVVACNICKTKNRIPEKKQHLAPLCGKCGGGISVGASAVPVQLQDAAFQEFVKNSELPVMVDFYSVSCGPCLALAPIIDQLAVKYLGKVVIAKIDTGRNPGTAAHYKIRGVPTLLFFKDGKMVEELVGAPPESQLHMMIEQLIRAA